VSIVIGIDCFIECGASNYAGCLFDVNIHGKCSYGVETY
jgi:hypothetical protein